MEGRDTVREKLARLTGQAQAARDRNETGRISGGLSRGIRGTRYMLNRTISAEKRPTERNGGGDGKTRETQKGNMSSPISGPCPKTQEQPAESNSRLRKFGRDIEGREVEMLTPTLQKQFPFTDENGRKQTAYEIYEGRLVRQNWRGEKTISPSSQFLIVAADPRFREYPSAQLRGCWDLQEAVGWCQWAVGLEANDRAREKEAEERRKRELSDDWDW